MSHGYLSFGFFSGNSAFLGTPQGPNQAIGIAIHFQVPTKHERQRAIGLSPGNWPPAMNLDTARGQLGHDRHHDLHRSQDRQPQNINRTDDECR
jgi:hypothetical protein